MNTTSVIIVRQTPGRRLDGTAVANATGVVSQYSTAPCLSDSTMSQVGWALDGIGGEEFKALVDELRGIFGRELVTAVIITPAPAVAPIQQPPDDGLRIGPQRNGIATS